MQASARVGLFVLIFMGLMLGAFAVLQKSFFSKPVELYYAEFPDAGGITSGSSVLMAGVKVGHVQEVKIVAPNKAKLTLAVEKGTFIPEHTTALIPASFISIGDMKIQLIVSAKDSGQLTPGSTIVGRLGSPLDAIAPESGKTLEEVNKTLVSIQGLLEDKGLKKDLSDLMKSVALTSKKFGMVAGHFDNLIVANQSKFSSLLASTSATLQNMQAVSLEVKKLVASGELQGKTTALLDNLNAAVIQGRELVSSLQGFVGDPEMRGNMKETLGNFKVMSESGTKIASNAEKMSANGIEISEETKTLMKKANQLADQVQSLIEKFNKTVDKIGQGKNLVKDIEFEATLARESNPGRTRTDFNAYIPIGKEKAMLGIYDAFETNKVNLQFLKQTSPNLGLRYGVYAGKPGIGVDYDATSRLGLRGDLFGLNDPRLDFRLNYRISSGLSGWAGVNNIFEKVSPSVGVTIRK